MATTDVGIVGAGFAGLAAALTLRRHRHSVLLFNGGPCRNSWASEVHGYLGARGLSGAEMWRTACEQAQEVGAEIVQASIAEARQEGDEFLLKAAQGPEWRVLRLLLATGVRDSYPDIDNFFDFYGRSVHNCPHCDAYEVRDKPVALVRARGTGPIFDVDNMLRVEEYSPNVWPSTVERDVPRIADHIKASWDNRETALTYMQILRRQVA